MPPATRSTYKPDRFAILLFWLMAVLGGALLAPCLILPAWNEYHTQWSLNQTAIERNAELAGRLETVQKQIDYIEHDPAYVERIARHELGLKVPGVTSVLSEPQDEGPRDVPPPLEPPPAMSTPAKPDRSEQIADAIHRYPALTLFLNPTTRTPLMIFGAILLLTAIILLGNASRRRVNT